MKDHLESQIVEAEREACKWSRELLTAQRLTREAEARLESYRRAEAVADYLLGQAYKRADELRIQLAGDEQSPRPN